MNLLPATPSYGKKVRNWQQQTSRAALFAGLSGVGLVRSRRIVLLAGAVLRFRDDLMKIPHRLLRIFAVVCLLPALTATDGFAQANAVPLPMVPSLARGAPAASVGPSSKFVPTGLEANGGSILSGVYKQLQFRFSAQIPPCWAVVPSGNVKLPAWCGAAPPGKPEPGQSPLQRAHQVNRVLLVITENAPRKNSYQRKSIQIVATRLSVYPGPDAALGFLTHSQKDEATERWTPVAYLGILRK